MRLDGKLSEASDFNGNYLRLYLKNRGSRVARYSINLFLNGSPIGFLGDDSWNLAPEQDRVAIVRNPPFHGPAWNEGDVLQVQMSDRDTGQILGWSDSITWSQRPWTPLAVAIVLAGAGIAFALACS